MIKEFRILGFKRYVGLMIFLVLFSTALLIFTGFEMFGYMPHMDMSEISVGQLKKGMYLELEINEIYANFAEVKDGRGSYCIIPYPKEDEKEWLLAVYVPEKYKKHAKEHFENTLDKQNVITPIKLNGHLEVMDSDLKKLYDEAVKDLNYSDSEKVLSVYYKTAYMSFWDYVALVVCILVIIYIIVMTTYIVSGASQKRIKKQLKERNITNDDLIEDLNKGKSFNSIKIGEKYVAFVIGCESRMLAKEDIVKVRKEKVDLLVINTQRGKEYWIKVRSNVIDEVIKLLG